MNDSSFAYILEGIVQSPWPPHGGVFYYDVGTTRNRVKLVQDKIWRAGERIVERVVMLDLGLAAKQACTTRLQLAWRLKHISYDTMRYIVQRAVANIREPPITDAISHASLPSPETIERIGGAALWQLFWIRCKNQCSPCYDRRGGDIVAIAHLGKEGGFNCPICGGTGGEFILKS